MRHIGKRANPPRKKHGLSHTTRIKRRSRRALYINRPAELYFSTKTEGSVDKLSVEKRNFKHHCMILPIFSWIFPHSAAFLWKTSDFACHAFGSVGNSTDSSRSLLAQTYRQTRPCDIISWILSVHRPHQSLIHSKYATYRRRNIIVFFPFRSNANPS